MPLLLIANPVAGRNAPYQIERARKALESQGAEVEMFLTSAAGDAERRACQARTQPYSRIIAAGGDGTLNEVVNGLAGCDLPLAFIPLGTTNVFALEAGIPFDVEAAATIACSAPAQPVSLGLAGERYFLLMAGVGFDAQTVAAVTGRAKRILGKGAYVLAALSEFLRRPPRLFEVTLPGGKQHCSGLLLANARCYGGSFTLTPEARLTRPDLEASILKRPGRLALLRQALCLVRSRPLREPLGSTRTLDTIEVTDVGIPVQIDGDYYRETPMVFRCVPQALQLVFPPARQ